jgi:hypothetical protein
VALQPLGVLGNLFVEGIVVLARMLIQRPCMMPPAPDPNQCYPHYRVQGSAARTLGIVQGLFGKRLELALLAVKAAVEAVANQA